MKWKEVISKYGDWSEKKKKGMRVTEKEQNKKVDHEANIKYILTENMDNEFIKQISMNRFKKVSKIQSGKNTNKVILGTV